MNISYSWLKNYLDLNLPAEEIAKLLTNVGLEVEKIKEIENIRGGLKGVVIGKVLTKRKHQNADRLSITTVDIGKEEALQIVCGAPNVAIGQRVPVATIGTVLYDNDTPFKIKKGKIRGELSSGMICAEDELGLGKNHEGIMVLDSKAKIGSPASEYFNIESDIIFEIGLTPNRSDAMSHIGVARDLKVALSSNPSCKYYQANNFELCLPSVEDFFVDNNTLNIDVDVKNSLLCPRYSGISISNISVSESPEWLKKRLLSIGIKPMNNVVDITNYVLHETGQPLHAFDLAKIKNNKVIVSTIKQGTKFTTLDSVERIISSKDLMISNDSSPMCIAGVYGGINSGVSKVTKDIFLESAYFNPVSIRKTAKRHSLNTDASFRYERGCDPNITIYALKRAALLIIEICGGKIASEIIDIYPNKISHFAVNLSYKNMDKLIGEVIDRNIIKNIIIGLEIKIKEEDSKGLKLLVPPFRADVQREVDIIEEILRIYGYNNIQIPLKLNSSIFFSKDINEEEILNTISDLLSNNGFHEIINNSLTKREYTNLIPELNADEDIYLLNPLSKDLDVMRQSLLFAALKNIAYNQNRKIHNIKFYEFGKTYKNTKEGNVENQHLLIIATGKNEPEKWNITNQDIDFFYIKQKVEHVLNRLGIKSFKKEKINTSGFYNGLSYSLANKKIVFFGKLNQNLCDEFGVKSEVFAANFNWSLILELLKINKIKYQQVSKFPEVRRDLSLLIDKSISFDQLKKVAQETDTKILKSVDLFDVYEGNNLPEGKKSYSLSFMMSDKNTTLKDKQVDKVMERLIQSFTKNFSAKIR